MPDKEKIALQLNDISPANQLDFHFEAESQSPLQRLSDVLSRWGVETHGIAPVPQERRQDTRMYQFFFAWFGANMNILAFYTGVSGPAFFDLGLKESLLVLVVVDIICCTVPAYFAIFGPKLGTRAMVQARYSWGYYGSILPSALNVFSLQGFLILNCIIGGQVLASVSDHLDTTIGIVTIGVISFTVAICGYKIVQWYESIAWIPNVVGYVVILAVGAQHLTTEQSTPSATPAALLSFGTIVGSTVLSWCTMMSDYGVYHDANAASFRVFIYTYLGIFSAMVTGHILGAAFAASAPFVPSWSVGFKDGSDIGGLISAILAPTGVFGKFLIVLLALSIPSACAPTMYSFGTSFMAIAPFFAKVPRYMFAVISTAILIPVAIVGASRFYATFLNILSVIGYWIASFAAIILTEHFVFRQNNFSAYVIEEWDQPRRLPLGIAATVSFVASFSIIIPTMHQALYNGPIAKAGTGDIGMLTGFFSAGLMYLLMRVFEKKLCGKARS